MADPFKLESRAASFRYAFRGLGRMMRTEANARIHALATAVILAAGYFFGIDRIEWLLLTLTIGAVWSLEAMNTAVEALADAVSTEPNPQIERAKDAAAGAVLVAAIAAICVALLILAPEYSRRSPSQNGGSPSLSAEE